MKELVFFESIGIKIDAFTTSRTIAEGTNIEPRKVKDAIRKHQKAKPQGVFPVLPQGC